MNDISNTIFDLQLSRKDREMIVRNSDLELDVAADIIEETLKLPYVGSIIKLGKVAKSYIDYRFFRKLGKFLKSANEIPEEKVYEFLSGLEDKDIKRISDYLTQLLYNAEEDIKAEFMGKIYKRRVLGEIDNDMMLRLCSVVIRAYITDLYSLADYKEISEVNNYITDNLLALGVLSDEGNVYEEKGDGWEGTGFGPTKHSLNRIGIILLRILSDEPIEDSDCTEKERRNISLRTMTAKEVSDMANDIINN